MVAARRSDFERAPGSRLPSNRAEVALRFGIGAGFEHRRLFGDVGEGRLAAQPANHGANVRRGQNRHPFDEHRLVTVCFGNDRVLETRLARASQQRENAAHGTKLTRKRELADQECVGKLLGRNPFTRRQDRRSDGEVEPCPRLRDIARGQVQDQMPRRKRKADRRQSSAHPNPAFANAPLRQSDDVEPRQTFAEPHFDLNGMGFDTDEAGGMRGREHAGGRARAVPGAGPRTSGT